LIKYKNGTVDRIVVPNVPVAQPQYVPEPVVQAPPPPPDPKIYPSGGKFISDGRRFGESELYNKLLSAHDPKITLEVRKSKTGKGLQFLSLGVIPGFIGGAVTAIVAATSEVVNNGNAPNSGKVDYTPCVPWFIGGAVFLGTGIGFKVSYNNHRKKAIELYNQKF
jgi:hypothetical protein